MPRIVFDTNVLISALLFADPRHLGLVEHWQTGRILPLRSEATWQELLEVAYRAEFAKPTDRIEARLADYAKYAKLVAIDPTACARLPRCRDRDDQKFLDLAHCGPAEALLTYDKALLKMNRRALGFAILTPEAWQTKTYSTRTQVCVRPNKGEPMKPRTASFLLSSDGVMRTR